MTLMFYFIKRLINKLFKHCTFKNHSHIFLHCVNQELALDLNILRMAGRPAEYKFFAKGAIKDIKISGFWTPILTYIWDDFYIIHSITNRKIDIPQTISLSWFQALILHKIFQHLNPDSCIFPLTKYHGQVFVIPLETPPNTSTSD